MNEIVSAEETIPDKLLIIPLMGKPIFPGIFTPIMITQEEDIKLVEMAINGDKVIGLVLTQNDENENEPENGKETKNEELYNIGTVARIVKKINLPDGGINIFISTLKRFRIKKLLSNSPPIIAAIETLDDILDDSDEDELKALTRALITEMKTISENNPIFTEEMRLNMINIDNPGKIADFITSILNIDRHLQQEVLEELSVRKRMEQALIYIKKELELVQIQRKITHQINEKIEKNQREYFLREEIKAIKKELGEPVDGRSSEYLGFKEQIEAFKFEGEIKEQVEKELEKLNLMEPNSAEYVVTRNYLDIIVNLPWNSPPPEKINLKKGRSILEKDHYGLKDVKERIVEYLAVRKLKADNRGSIICLVGPPGVGKTSVGKSIARALNRPFFRFSVGGMRDEAEIKGHRRTYIGAMPGKLIQGLKIVKTQAPVFMIDEIDKMGSSFQGDPSSAILEALDPEQNNNFRDHYLDLPFDLSRVVFIATANTLDTIPSPLLDRMEIIRLAGYIMDEKVQIARGYLIPKSLEKHGLHKTQVKYPIPTLKTIGENYAREAGVRNFEKALDRIHRKLALRVVESETGDNDSFIIQPEGLEEFLKKPHFPEERVKRVTKPGMAVGLAWTNFGGDTLLIEAAALPGKGGLQLTGQMGDVMKESANIAFSHVKSIAKDFDVKDEFFATHNIHLHIPEGATPKDGPSAGITMAIALLSLVRNKKLKANFTMTGELSLTGKVLAIGGLKEKTIAARRNRIKNIIIPEQNKRDLDEIPENVKKGLTYHPVENFSEVVELLL